MKRNIFLSTITGIILGAIFLVSVIFFPYIFTLLLFLITIKAYMELNKAFKKELPVEALSICSGFLLFSAYFFDNKKILIPFVSTIILLTLYTYFVKIIKGKSFFTSIASTLFSYIYICIPFVFVILIIRNFGYKYLIFLILLIVVSDSFGLIVGSNIGKHKLCPSISPNKTVEGFLAGIILTPIFAVGYSILFLKMNIVVAIFGGIFISILATFGDLCESIMKRSIKVKDFGTIIKGHGGVLDRFDAILILSPLFFVFLHFL